MKQFKNIVSILIILTFFNGVVTKTTEAIDPFNHYHQKIDTLKLPESITEEELEDFKNHGNHYLHAGGHEIAAGLKKRQNVAFHYRKEIQHYGGEIDRGVRHIYNPKLMDQAWTLMLHKQGIINENEAKKVLSALEKLEVGSERNLSKILDEHHASIPYFGKTMVEPIPRIEIREKLLDVIDAIHELQRVILNEAQQHSGTIMPGMTHMAHAQPTTYGAYLLAFHDGISRGLEYLELAYKHTNRNNGGCGATSGAGFPVDRDYITELLGFDETLELTYDAEPGQDWAVSTLNALSNIALVISRASTDYSVWGMDGYGTHNMAAGASSFMPHKAHAGSEWELIRINVNNILGANVVGFFALNKSPLQDNLEIYQAAYRSPHIGAIGALSELELLAKLMVINIGALKVDKEKLLQLTREGWGCTTDLVAKLVIEKGLEVRQAHRISAILVRIAREHRKIKPYELTGEMLDEAARLSNDPEPHLTTEELREIMDPVKFIERHNNRGEPNPKETIRMVNERRDHLKESEQLQALRRGRAEAGYKKLKAEIDKILKNN